MKKRKRKMKANEPSSQLALITVMVTLVIHLAASCLAGHTIAGEPLFDQHHSLNISTANKLQGASNGSKPLPLPYHRPLKIVQPSEPHRQITITSSFNDLSPEEPPSRAGSEHKQLNESSQDDLLAVESANGRSFSLGKPPQISPPYATTNLTSLANNTDLQQQPLNDSQLIKLYRSPLVPTFIGRYAGRQDIRLLQPPSPSGRQPDALRYQPVSTASLLPVTTWHSLYFPRPPLRPIPTTTTSTRAPPVQVQEADDFNFGLKVANWTNRKASSSVDYWRAENATDTANRSHSFPKFLGQSSENAEDSFEQSLALGNYQRTNASNMSWPQLLRQATEGNVMESLMITNRSMVSLLCETNDMLLRLKFKQPFRGLVSSNLDSGHDSCRLVGSGAYYYEMRISLQDCGTRQEMPRLFINNIRIQFHQSSSLDTVDDELKTIICSYPIKPRAPPPPELPTVLPERIVEAPSEPARLVYYEPLVLISGLLFLSLAVLGFTTGAYMFTKRYRGSRARFGGLSPSSSRIYRNSPAQAANFLVAPPLIGLGKDRTPKSGDEAGVKYPNYRADARRPARNGEDFTQQRGRAAAISLNPGESADSLTRNDDSSVTTIEVPYNSSKNTQSESPAKAADKTVPNQMQTEVKSSGQSTDVKSTAISPTQQVSVTFLKPTPRASGKLSDSINSPRSSPKLTRFSSTRGERLERHQISKMKYKTAVTRERQLQKGRTHLHSPPTYGSLRSRLTSPREYKRLQGIARLFDEILIESHEDQGENGGVLVYKSRLRPSKYENRILDTMNEGERGELADLLLNNELFRSYVVDAADRDTFHRKLRENPVYADKFRPETWLLLEEIVLDPDVDSETTTSALLPAEFGPENVSITSKDDSSRTIELDNIDMNEVKYPLVNQRAEPELEKRADTDDLESFIVKVDAREPDATSTNQDDSLDSDAKTATFTRQPKGDFKPVPEVQHKDVVRVSQFNSTALDGGMTGTLINIDSVTNFTTSKDFSTFTRSRIEHTRYESEAVDSLPLADERVGAYEYVRETLKTAPEMNNKFSSRRLHGTLTRDRMNG